MVRVHSRPLVMYDGCFREDMSKCQLVVVLEELMANLKKVYTSSDEFEYMREDCYEEENDETTRATYV